MTKQQIQHKRQNLYAKLLVYENSEDTKDIFVVDIIEDYLKVLEVLESKLSPDMRFKVLTFIQFPTDVLNEDGDIMIQQGEYRVVNVKHPNYEIVKNGEDKIRTLDFFTVETFANAVEE